MTRPRSLVLGLRCLASVTLTVAALTAAPLRAAGPPAMSDVARTVAGEKAPGTHVLVIDHGRAVYERTFGVADLTTKRPIDVHTRFEIGSVTKQFTAAAILQLAEHGKLALSDRLGTYVREYPPGRAVTLEQLLWQVSGIPDYSANAAFWKLVGRRGYRAVFLKDVDERTILALIAGQPLHFQPGSKWEYSNTNYYLLGLVVAAASGMSWEQYVRTHLFAPAGMTESSFAPEESAIPDMATGYGLARHTFKPIPTGPDIAGQGDGAIVSTARDLAKWDAALFAGTIISRRSLALMSAPGPHPQGPQQGYGFGWAIDIYDGARRLSHNGLSLGFSAVNQVFPSLSQAVIVLTNSNYAEPTDIADVAFNRHNPELAARDNAGVGGEDRAVTAIVKRLWAGMASGHVDQTLLEPRMGRFMASTPANTSQFAQYGSVQRWVYHGMTSVPSGPLYKYRLLFTNGKALDLNVVVNGRHKVAALTFRRR